MQIRSAMKYYYTHITMTQIRTTNNSKCWQECGETVFSVIGDGNEK